MWRKPVWAEGQFVSQHQFQAQDRYHEGLLHDRIVGIRRFGWGLTRLEVDERLLQSGQFGLRRLTAIWPDGLVVDAGGPKGEQLPAPRPFEPHMKENDAPLDVLVGVTNEGGANVPALGEAIAAQRYARVVTTVDDFNTGGSPQEVEFAAPNLRLVFGPERRERMATLPIAQLVRQSDGKIVLRDTFIPPVLRITAAPFLTSSLRRVIGAMTARQKELVAGRKQRSPSNVEFHFTDARRFWLLHTLNSSIGVLTHLLDCEDVHPEEVYLAMVQLIGALSTFSTGVDPLTLPKFNYVQLGDVFEALFAHVVAMVSIDSAPSYVEVPLERRPDGMFVGKLPEARIANHEFFVSVKSGLPESLVRERVPQLLKVAGWRHITEVVKQARHGVRAEVEWTPSSALPIKPGLCFFRLRREGAFWEEVAKSSTIALYMPNDDDWRDVWVNVYALDPSLAR